MKRHLILYFRRKQIQQLISVGNRLMEWIIGFISLAILTAFIYRIGYVQSEVENQSILSTYDQLTLPLFVCIVVHILLGRLTDSTRPRTFTYLLYSLLLVKSISLHFLTTEEGSPLYEFVLGIINAPIYSTVVLVAIAIIHISTLFVNLLKITLNPSRVIMGGFLGTILLGAGLLLLPNATTSGIAPLDALFVSTSAVCVTGLTPVAVDTAFTPLGHLFILLLIQVGGIGVMTLTSFFVVFFMGNVSVYSQMSVKEVVSSDASYTLKTILFKIIGITVFIELIGAVLIFQSIHGQMGKSFWEEIGLSIFHAISAFCNAGFSTLPNNLMAIPLGNHLFFLTISLLIVFGGIGFPVLSNAFQTIKSKLSGRRKRFGNITLYRLNTSVAVVLTGILLIGGSLAIGAFEWNNAFRELPLDQKIVQAFFNASSPRTAGFNAQPITDFTLQTTLVTILLMWIGGGSQSTAGGIKVNTLGTILAMLRSVVRRSERVELLGREIPYTAIRFAFATIIFSGTFIILSVITLSFTDPDIPLLNLFYETVSAISTVGLSLDTTPLLSNAGKVIIISLMYFGRIGLLTLFWGMFKEQRIHRYRYPKDEIIIN